MGNPLPVEHDPATDDVADGGNDRRDTSLDHQDGQWNPTYFDMGWTHCLALFLAGLCLLRIGYLGFHGWHAERAGYYRLPINEWFYIEDSAFDVTEYPKSGRLAEYGGLHAGVPVIERPISQFAVVGNTLIGATDQGFFVFEMEDSITLSRNQPWRPIYADEDTWRIAHQRNLTTCPDEKTWRIALNARGINNIPRLEAPVVVAASRPIAEIQPEKCRMAGGIFGLMDGDLGELLLLSLLPISALIGFVCLDEAIRIMLVSLTLVAGAFGVVVLGAMAAGLLVLLILLPLSLRISAWAANQRRRRSVQRKPKRA